jgi:thiamine-monophosphate kinase
VGAIIDEAAVPIHSDATELSRRDRVSPLQHALNDGEDYELLFTTSADANRGIRVGRITAEPGVFLRDRGGVARPMEPRSWQHEIGH